MPSKANSGWQLEKTGNGHIPHCHPSNNAQSSHSKGSQSGVTDEGVTSTQSTASSDEGDGDDGDGNGAEADELDEDDANGDGMAPSGCTIDQDGKQAGHITGKSIQHLSYSSEKRKRRLDTPDEATNPPKALKRTRDARQIDQSDDDDYNGVDLISDSGEEGQGIEHLEEMLIIESEEEYDFNATNVSQPPGSVSSDGEDWSPWALGRGLYVTDVPYFNDQIGRVKPSEMAIDAEIFRSAGSFQSKHIEEPNSPKPRRVRFAEQAIPPGNRSRTNSVFPGERVTSSQGPENLDSEDSCGNSSGYETDLGETTEEEELSRPVTARPQLLMRRTSMSSQNSERIHTPTPGGPSSSRVSGNRRWGPRMACWITDPTKPIAFIDSNGKTLVICPALRPPKARKGFLPTGSSGSSTANTSPRTSLPKLATAFDDSERSDVSSQELIQSNFGYPQNLTLSGLVDGTLGNSHIRDGYPSGPPEMIYFNDLAADSIDQEDDEDEGNGDEFEYINFGDDEEEDEDEKNQPLPVTAAMSHSSQVKTQTPASKDSPTQSFPTHIDTRVVTAFRRSQHHETIPRHLHDGLLAKSDITSKTSSHFAASDSLSSVQTRGFEC